MMAHDALIYQALICGLKDYVEKNGFPGVILGLSGGIDSALTLCLAVDAFGASRVQAVLLPSRYTANMSNEDAILQAEALGVNHTTLPIEPAFITLLETLTPSFKGLSADITEENLQARIRGILLMALSNKSGNMLLTTSNKSEVAVGYSTLYGDMAGGFAVLKDVLKTSVYALARYRNTLKAVIPERVLTRAPSAELANNQTDQDSLPDYAILDAILTGYMNDNLSADEIIKLGYKADDVLKVIKLIKRNEYKRRQAAPGVKISTCAFGRDWRYPLTSGF
jgi:NAD+ synthase (glutamine-hydrolysing)